MDIWKFYDITHREHLICNPTSDEKLTHLVELLRLPTEARVVDIACGKGEFLIRLGEAYGVHGDGIDISPFYVAEAEKKLKARAADAEITFNQMDGADFSPDEPHQFDLASCIGASWVYGGHEETLDALIGMVKPGGWVITGEPFWRQEPPEDYLQTAGIAREAFGSHFTNAEAGKQRELDLMHTIVSSSDDWDTYEGLQWYATAEYARTHPEDPDLTELVEQVEKARATYLRWGRDVLGWAIYVFRLRTPWLPSGE